MNHLLLVLVVCGGAVLVARASGALLGWAWERRRPTEDVHPWAFAAPALVAGVPLVGIAVALVALIPAVPWTWLSGVCSCQAYGGLHVCPFHPAEAARLAPGVLLLAGIVLATAARGVAAALLRLRDLKHLAAEGRPDPSGVVTVDQGGRPLVFVAGMRRPRLFVEGAWWAALPARERGVIRAHEQAHIDARDPGTLAWLDVILVLFAPKARAAILQDWLLAAEMRADAAAVEQDGDALFVAEVLCRYTRAGAPLGALALGGQGLAARVRALVAGGSVAPARFSRRTWVAAGASVFVAGNLMHRIFEVFLRLL